MKFHRKSYLSVCSFGGIGIAGVLPERQEEDTCFDEQGCLPGDGLLLNRWKNSALQSAFLSSSSFTWQPGCYPVQLSVRPAMQKNEHYFPPFLTSPIISSTSS
jgi:hypothetical protein